MPRFFDASFWSLEIQARPHDLQIAQYRSPYNDCARFQPSAVQDLHDVLLECLARGYGRDTLFTLKHDFPSQSLYIFIDLSL